jgi:hypothetical protein
MNYAANSREYQSQFAADSWELDLIVKNYKNDLEKNGPSLFRALF